ncbi:bifunctional protein-serine/threonine kinase/phosphatase [Aquisalimonas lutea]|uniref:bifunctional protein-serine/threonine kinase/phosphatase n=1 Tax=Aquisalimonas lutea TaxID=1327750 RepID=UPI0025B35462|nr:bifunctional protein-serine/threonine kinase/phosphatase [Aquisalimonas lutea]MDN3519633.1 bifunctional protein-serine/threonine kinase/phosphatase [Aquisalimonas lutea]
MTAGLQVAIGQHSDKGRKEANQDFHGACVPDEPRLSAKGVAAAVADGISSSDVAHIASETAVKSFLEDYYCTSEAWSVKKSCQRVLAATNSWLHAQTRRSRYRDDMDRGYVCTLSALVIKSTTAHLFHVGDARIYRVRGRAVEQLTEDHRQWVAGDRSYLARALGVDHHVEIDYQSLHVEPGDVFVLATDGVYEHVGTAFLAATVGNGDGDLDTAARALVHEALDRGSGDNLTVQILRVDALPEPAAADVHRRLTDLPFPPEPDARAVLDGYEIVRPLHASSRSRVYLAVDRETGARVALKTPASDIRNDPRALERFLMEEWIARRINSPHVLKPFEKTRENRYLYVVMELIEGTTLTQWMKDHPKPDVEKVRAIIEQIGKGLRAFHRQEMLHQDIRPDNILIDDTGTARIIDFGSVRVAGITETARADDGEILGTEQYTAPEYFLGEGGSSRSDLFSLATIAYQMLTGSLPYGTRVPQCRTRAARNKLKYTSVRRYNRDCPAWIDGALRKALHPDPAKRHDEVSEFLFDLHNPRREFISETRPPLIERDPELFWKGTSLVLAVIVAILAILLLNQAPS